jgi:hypothetical protein
MQSRQPPLPPLPSVNNARFKAAVKKVQVVNFAVKTMKDSRRPSLSLDSSAQHQLELSKLHGTFVAEDRLRFGFPTRESVPELSCHFRTFAVTLIYELLPPFAAAMFVIFNEGWTKGINEARQRQFLPDRRILIKPIFWANVLLIHPLFNLWWFVNALWWVDFNGIRKLCFLQEFLVVDFLFVARALVIATKYSYYRKDELQALQDPKLWGVDHSLRKLVGAGWSNPLAFPGLLEEECHLAAGYASCDILATSFLVSERAAAALRMYDTFRLDSAEARHSLERSDEFPADNGVNSANEVTIASLLLHISKSCHGVPPPKKNGERNFLSALLMSFVAPAVRSAFGSPFGDPAHWHAQLLLATTAVASIVFSNLLGLFAFLTANDLQRRANAMRMLLRLVSPPGVPFAELLGHVALTQTVEIKDFPMATVMTEAMQDGSMTGGSIKQSTKAGDQLCGGGDKVDGDIAGPVIVGLPTCATEAMAVVLAGDGLCVHLDLKQPGNIFAFLLLRKTLRKVGSRWVTFSASHSRAHSFSLSHWPPFHVMFACTEATPGVATCTPLISSWWASGRWWP